jgi:hypothetical protein
MSSNLADESLDWHPLTPSDFEKLIFFLLDDMGFKNLKWRKGGEGISATDGGRDLEATYAKIEPDDALRLEQWWIEVKYRSHTLEPDSVQKAVLNTAGRRTVDVFVIVTNNVISNKTSDWVEQFQESNPIPRIVVWQRHDLERILRKYPRTVAKFFPGSQTLAERLEGVKDGFWNSILFPRLDDIEDFWKEFSALDWDCSNLLPIIIAEASIGKLHHRQWGLVVDEETLLETLILGLVNVPILITRFEQYGRNIEPLDGGLEYLLQAALSRMELESVLDAAIDPYRFVESSFGTPFELINFILAPVLSNIYHDLLVNCGKDCPRYNSNWSSEPENQSLSHFSRFVKRETQRDNNGKPFVLIVDMAAKCTLGIVPVGKSCLLEDVIPDSVADKTTLRKLLGFAQQVIRARVEYITKSSSDGEAK